MIDFNIPSSVDIKKCLALNYNIDEIRKASALEQEEAKEHIQNSWAALGNNLPGDVIKESYLAWEYLRNSEKLDRQACNMENTNIDFENSRR